MSLQTLGKDDVTEEIQAFKDRLGSKEAQIAAQQSQLLKKAAELDEIKASFNDAVRKLNEETQRALRLESDLTKCSEDLRNEKIASENNQSALQMAQERLKEKELEARELESTLESLSYTSEEYNSRAAKTSREKSILEARVRELEANLRQLASAPTTPSRQRGPRRSSSLSNVKIVSLETQLNELLATVARKDEDVTTVNKKLEGVQRDLIRANNENMALEARSKRKMQELESLLDEKEAELQYLRSGDAGQGREEELLRRIEEDEAKIEGLERLVGDAYEVPSLRDRVARAEHRLREEKCKLEESEERNTSLAQEHEEALEQLEVVRMRVTELEASLRGEKEQLQQEGRSPTQIPDKHAIEGTARLLSAVERLRTERNDLRRDLEFIQMESKFKVAALESQIASGSASIHSSDGFTNQPHRRHEGIAGRLEKATIAFSIVVQHLHNSLLFAEKAIPMSRNNDVIVSSLEAKLKSAEAQLSGLTSSLEDATTERDDLVLQLETESQEWKVKLDDAIAAHEKIKADLLRVDTELTEVISDRNSLSLQVENLTNDLKSVNRELEEAEKRYTSLQFHQLSSMSSTDANSALRKQIAELEERIMRRNEQIGIHQHDIRRMETNLRLQEERLNELTAEMETLASQKEAMVEDCADAREARDDALSRVEHLEDEMERLEAQLEEKDLSLESLIRVMFETVARWREKMRLAEIRKLATDTHLQAVGQKHEHAMQRVKELELDVEKTQERLEVSESEKIAVADEQQLLLIRASDEKKQAEIAELQGKLCVLQSSIAEKEASHHSMVEELRSLIAQKDALHAENDLEGELVQLKMKHVEELGKLQSRLVETTSALEEAEARHGAAEVEFEERLSDSVKSRETMEKRLSDLSDELSRSQLAERDLAVVREEQDEKIRQLEAEVAEARDKVQELNQSESAAEASFQATIAELTKERDELEVQLGSLKDEMEEIRVRLEEESRKSARVTEEVSRLGARLQEEVETRARLEAAHRQRVKSLNDQVEQMEFKVEEVERKSLTTLGQLKDTQSELELLQEEKHKLQCDMTALEAQIQRAKTFDRYQESQLKESERKILALDAELEKTRNSLAVAEKAHNAAEMKLSMQNAHQKRVDQELAALKAKPNLEQALAELEERNDEMEELLKKKCAEIEQNDDRVIEMLKENKKLTTKVESLTRKVQNLQTKLSAVKASAASSTEKPEKRDNSNSPIPTAAQSPLVPLPRSRSNTTLSGTVVSPPAPEAAETISVQNRGRTRSVTSILRPRSPDKSVFSLPVFKGSTSPKRRTTEIDNPPVTSSRKRSAPEDFETCDNIPVQVFTPDSLPESSETKDSSTPRVRRVLSNIQSGFTPVRSRTTTGAVPPPPAVFAPRDPAPRAVSVAAPSVSSTPMDSRAPKRGTGWLGKIRGASSHPGRPQFGECI
ncbi:hypothetical protein L218DRAFT_889408 [Marasmius fiardii PR-910]|nr:hypothetical protein L218DRAFT_889408 [Marasmius fiardii PR-910]